MYNVGVESTLAYIYIYIYIYIYSSIYVLVCLSVCLSIYLPIYLTYLSIYPSLHLSIYLLIYPSVFVYLYNVTVEWNDCDSFEMFIRRLLIGNPVAENAFESERKDLLSELELMKQLKPHPYVIKLLGCVTKSGKYWNVYHVYQN